MNQQRARCRICLSLLALFLLAEVSWAGGIGFRNDTRFPIIVQGSTTMGGVVRRGPALLIPPGKTAWDNNLPKGLDRSIIIYDGDQNNAVLHRRTVQFQGQDLLFSIQPIPGTPAGQPKAIQMVPNNAPGGTGPAAGPAGPIN